MSYDIIKKKEEDMKTKEVERSFMENFVNRSDRESAIKIYQARTNFECVFCGKNVLNMEEKTLEFPDKISRIEYGISGLCKECQRDYFGY
jgi:hypothetical protein